MAQAGNLQPRAPDKSVECLSIKVLHLGNKTRLLEDAGFRTLRDLKDVPISTFFRLSSIGRRTVEQLVVNHMALREAVDDEGEIDWDAYCAATGISLLPARAPEDGYELLTGLPSFFEAIAEALDDRVLTAILLDRICKPPRRQKTLEQISEVASPPLTRERIRQKERKLLGQITGGLLNDDYDGLDIHFHPGFAHWWQIAADSLVDLTEIEVSKFVALLSTVWDVPQANIIEHLPTLVAIVTGEPQMAVEFRALTTLDSRLFADNRDLDRMPVLKLRLGKEAVRLAEAGLYLLGDVIADLRADNLEKIGGSAAKRVTEHLNLLAPCLHENGFDWAIYRSTFRLDQFPKKPPESPADFVRTLDEVVQELLRIHIVTIRAADIFRYRTGKNPKDRMTLHEVAEALGTFGSTVKREETIFLAWLNDVLVSREFFRLEVWLDDRWLSRWSEALETYALCEDDYDNFSRNLAWQWRLNGYEIKTAVPTLWAVFSGYPDGRRPRMKLSSEKAKAEAEAAIGRIRLQGFRRAH